MNRVITISREFGSGGRTIGKKTAEALGIPCYDRELLEKIAKESGFDEKYIQEAGEYAPGGFLAAAFSHTATGPNNADYLWNIQYKIISQLAEEGPCVIVGRCADYMPAGLYPCGHGLPGQAHCGGVRGAGTVPRTAAPGQGQAPGCLPPVLHRHEVGPCPEL